MVISMIVFVIAWGVVGLKIREGLIVAAIALLIILAGVVYPSFVA